ncbi:unnamed protein product [Polarella glacialis]|uniref:Uncharacterized protein n=1 Tax=Polarella glacialis TaxID=89957 RepID=A0A813JKS0_POLGL|nr:unnamed protein product [Polarella glacialis]
MVASSVAGDSLGALRQHAGALICWALRYPPEPVALAAQESQRDSQDARLTPGHQIGPRRRRALTQRLYHTELGSARACGLCFFSNRRNRPRTSLQAEVKKQ